MSALTQDNLKLVPHNEPRATIKTAKLPLLLHFQSKDTIIGDIYKNGKRQKQEVEIKVIHNL